MGNRKKINFGINFSNFVPAGLAVARVNEFTIPYYQETISIKRIRFDYTILQPPDNVPINPFQNNLISVWLHVGINLLTPVRYLFNQVVVGAVGDNAYNGEECILFNPGEINFNEWNLNEAVLCRIQYTNSDLVNTYVLLSSVNIELNYENKR